MGLYGFFWFVRVRLMCHRFLSGSSGCAMLFFVRLVRLSAPWCALGVVPVRLVRPEGRWVRSVWLGSSMYALWVAEFFRVRLVRPDAP